HRVLRGGTLRAGFAWPAAGRGGDARAAGAPQVPSLPGAAHRRARHINLRALQDTSFTPDGRTGLPALLDHADQLFDAARGHRLHQPSGPALSTTRLPSCAGARVASCSLPARSATTSGTW